MHPTDASGSRGPRRIPPALLCLVAFASQAWAASPSAPAPRTQASPRASATARMPRCPAPDDPAQASAPSGGPAGTSSGTQGYGDAHRQAARLQRDIARMQRLLTCGDRRTTDADGARDAWEAVDDAAADQRPRAGDVPDPSP